MRRIKPIWITILTAVVFVGTLLAGMQSDWWITDGRKTPLDGVTSDSHETETVSDGTEAIEEEHTEEEHSETEESGLITGDSTLQDVLDSGIPMEMLDEIFEGSIADEDPGMPIKSLTEARGLKFRRSERCTESFTRIKRSI